MGAMSRRKGARFERECAKAFSILFPGAKRGIGQSRWGGEVPDVDGTPFWPECKRGNSSSVTAALKQAVEARGKSNPNRGAPLAIIRRNGERATASMYLMDFFELLAGYTIPDPAVRAEVLMRLQEAVRVAEGGSLLGKKAKGESATE